MKAKKVKQEVEVDVQDAYCELSQSEQIEFLLFNIEDLPDDALIVELESRGYPVTEPVSE